MEKLTQAIKQISVAEDMLFSMLREVNHTFPEGFDHISEGLTFFTCDDNGYPLRAYVSKIEDGMVEVRDYENNGPVFTDRIDMLQTQEVINLATYFFHDGNK